MNEYQLRLQVLSSDLKPNEKMIMFAIIMKVDWKTFKGQVSVGQLVEMTNSTIPTVKRILGQLTKKKWITRSSKHIEKERSTAAYTQVLFDNVSIKTDTDIKNDTGIKNDTSIKTDTPLVSKLIPPSIKTDTPNGIKNDTHTISNNSNNNNQSINSMVTTKWGSFGGGDDFTEEPKEEEREVKKVYKFRYHSSITDPEERKRVEDYVIKNSHRLRHIERERLLFPDLTKPLI